MKSYDLNGEHVKQHNILAWAKGAWAKGDWASAYHVCLLYFLLSSWNKLKSQTTLSCKFEWPKRTLTHCQILFLHKGFLIAKNLDLINWRKVECFWSKYPSLPPSSRWSEFCWTKFWVVFLSQCFTSVFRESKHS